MKVRIIQPYYPFEYEKSDEAFAWELDALEKCDASLDLIVLPETADVPALAKEEKDYRASVEKYRDCLLEKAAATAARCNAMLFVSVNDAFGDHFRNTTVAFDRTGKRTGAYYKKHPVKSEIEKYCRDSDYVFEPSFPTILEMEGLRFAFLTCYDFYFYEAFAHIARYKPDIVIGCSHQRSDPHEALSIINRFAAYNIGAYIVRASVSLGEDSAIGGCSTVIAPDGKVLCDMKSRIGWEDVEIDPHAKYLKPMGFAGAPGMHSDYIEIGRRPWQYRPAGQALAPFDDCMPYPRLCAHRGFNTVAPENSMAAFGEAYGLGADEIEFDLWPTADGEIVSLHDSTLERVSDGSGKVFTKTLAELRELDFGIKKGEAFKGMRIVRFEDILRKFACHMVMNVHIKNESDSADEPISPWTEETLKKVADLIEKYDCAKYVYFMNSSVATLQTLRKIAPHIARCAGFCGDAKKQLENAVTCGCKKIQLFKPYFDQSLVDEAHAKGLRCTVFFADDPAEADKYLDMGIDTVLTNDFERVYTGVKHRLHTEKDPFRRYTGIPEKA